MSYIIDYNIFAIVLVVIVLISFLTRKRFGGRQSRYFLFLLLSTIGALVLEILSVSGGDVRIFTGEAAWIINMGCLLSVNLLLALTSGYIATITECERKVARRATAVLAVINTICCLAIITSRWTGFVFRILPGGIYERGPGHSLLYVAMASYITFISYVCVRYRKNMGMRRFMAVNSFCTLLIAAVAIQFLLPRYLVNLPAASLSLLIMYFAIQAPGEFIDELTSAYNHKALTRRCEDRFAHNEHFYILSFELNDFKKVNSFFGERCGDELLKKVTRYLMREYKYSEIYRVEGDWFAVVIPSSFIDGDSIDVLKRKSARFPGVWNYEGTEIPFDATVVYLDSNDFSDFHEMSEILVYAAENTRNGAKGEFFIAGSEAKSEYNRRKKVEAALKRSIDQRSISVVYQPVCDVHTGEIHSAEALARLHDDELGDIPPSEFIRIAEHNGMITSVGEIVYEQVCALIADNHLYNTKLDTVAVNLSAVECMQSHLHSMIIDTAERYGIPMRMLRFEITESTAVESISTLRHNMQELIAHGISFHLDDYGTGYSNLAMILSLPFSTIKLDKSILDAEMIGDDAGEYTRHLTALFGEMGMKVICEGVENAEQAARISRWNVNYGQGWYYSKPLPPDEFVKKVWGKRKSA